MLLSQAYESVVVGLFSIITGKDCATPHPYGRGGEQDAVYAGWSRDGFHFSRPTPPAGSRRTAFLPMSTAAASTAPPPWNRQNVQSVGGGFLVADGHLTPDGYPADAAAAGGAPADALLFFVGARSGSCAGAPTCDPATQGLNGNASTGLATLRRDRFASLGVPAAAAAAAATGEFSTRPVAWAAAAGAPSFLFVNVDVPPADRLTRTPLLPAALGFGSHLLPFASRPARCASS